MLFLFMAKSIQTNKIEFYHVQYLKLFSNMRDDQLELRLS